jgi:large subunit ribosomal protein L34
MMPSGAICTGLAPAPYPVCFRAGSVAKPYRDRKARRRGDEVTIAVSQLQERSSGTLPRFFPSFLLRDTIKRTFQPKKRYRKRVHGFLRRMSSKGGVRVVQNRRRKGRQRLTA